jgi:hypothetical protein
MTYHIYSIIYSALLGPGGLETSTTPNTENKKTTKEGKHPECQSGGTTLLTKFLIFVGFVAGLFVGFLFSPLKM